MKIVCLLGSPRRNGNSDQLAQRFCANATQNGASVETFALASLKYSGCQNLFQCKNGSEYCGVQDDVTPILKSISQADALILASPIYFTNVSGQLKLVIDRMFSFLVPDYVTAANKTKFGQGKHLVLIQTQGEPEGKYHDVLDQYSSGFKYLGYDHKHLIRAWGVREPGQAIANELFLQKTDQVIKSIFSP